MPQSRWIASQAHCTQQQKKMNKKEPYIICVHLQSNLCKWIPLTWITRLNEYHLHGPV